MRSTKTPSTAEASSIADRFPSYPLGALNAQQQEQFVRIAEGELCPCKGSTESLAICLESTDDSCALAQEAARVLIRGIQRRHSDPMISKAIADGLKQSAQHHPFALEHAPSQGASKAKVTMVVFADFECPYCKRMAQISDRMLAQFPNDLRVYFLHYPLASHSNATDAAIAAVAAQRQGKFWPYHDKLFQEQQALSRAMDATSLLQQWAKELGMDMKRFQEDMDDPTSYDRVRAQQQQGREANVRGTPSVFINGVAFSDIQSESALRDHIQSLIEEHYP